MPFHPSASEPLLHSSSHLLHEHAGMRPAKVHHLQRPAAPRGRHGISRSEQFRRVQHHPVTLLCGQGVQGDTQGGCQGIKHRGDVLGGWAGSGGA
jgi:hypothetical protein